MTWDSGVFFFYHLHLRLLGAAGVHRFPYTVRNFATVTKNSCQRFHSDCGFPTPCWFPFGEGKSLDAFSACRVSIKEVARVDGNVLQVRRSGSSKGAGGLVFPVAFADVLGMGSTSPLLIRIDQPKPGRSR